MAPKGKDQNQPVCVHMVGSPQSYALILHSVIDIVCMISSRVAVHSMHLSQLVGDVIGFEVLLYSSGIPSIADELCLNAYVPPCAFRAPIRKDGYVYGSM